MLGHHLLQRVDLRVQRGDQPDLAGDDGGVGGLDRGWLPQRRGAQHGLELRGPGLDVRAGSPAAAPRRSSRGTAGPPGRDPAPDRAARACPAADRSSKASSAAGKYSRSTCAAAARAGSGPRSGSDASAPPASGLDLRAVAGDRAVMGAVQPHDLGQHVRIAGVGLRARGGVPLPVPGHRHRVDREHLIPGREQRRAPTGRGRSRSRPSPAAAASLRRPGRPTPRARCSAISACSRVIPASPPAAGPAPAAGRARRRSRRRGGPRPSRPRRTAPAPPSTRRTTTSSAEETPRPNGQVLTNPRAGARHPISGHACSRPAGARSDEDLQAQMSRVLTRQPLPTEPAQPGRQNPLDECVRQPVGRRGETVDAGAYGASVATFAVRTVHGPTWDPRREIRDHRDWASHAPLMDGLVDDGFVVLGGPAGYDHGALLLVEAGDEQDVRARLGRRSLGSVGSPLRRLCRTVADPARRPAQRCRRTDRRRPATTGLRLDESSPQLDPEAVRHLAAESRVPRTSRHATA